VGLWRDAGAPFEAAVAQFALADAYRRGGERGVARVELDTARNAFAALGARWHVEQADVALHRLSEDQPVDRLRRTFVFTDVVNSTRLLAAMGDDAWASVLRWHDDTIRRQLASWNGEEVKQRGGGDGFFLVFDEAGAALAFAAAVQTEFASHRRTSGFAPEIRIGVHEADALRHAGDYSGRGVHEAARIAELAVGNQILASASTAARSARRGPAKTVQLRGLPGTVDVVEIDW
jgi:class 3 adenylate cyclase